MNRREHGGIEESTFVDKVLLDQVQVGVDEDGIEDSEQLGLVGVQRRVHPIAKLGICLLIPGPGVLVLVVEHNIGGDGRVRIAFEPAVSIRLKPTKSSERGKASEGHWLEGRRTDS